jgi:hypothetical protein
MAGSKRSVASPAVARACAANLRFFATDSKDNSSKSATSLARPTFAPSNSITSAAASQNSDAAFVAVARHVTDFSTPSDSISSVVAAKLHLSAKL